jgi:hypothetical protein
MKVRTSSEAVVRRNTLKPSKRDGSASFATSVEALLAKALIVCHDLAAWDKSDDDTDLLSEACSKARVVVREFRDLQRLLELGLTQS